MLLVFRYMMQGQHVDPEEAVQIHQDLQAKQSVAIHWGTFALAYEVTHTDMQSESNTSDISHVEFCYCFLNNFSFYTKVDCCWSLPAGMNCYKTGVLSNPDLLTLAVSSSFN